ncbi:MAG TPA: pitrilysin family protein [Polyangiaceae bacterium]|nr:pitrilysin family protein [Polyangiaceae bacterium]
MSCIPLVLGLALGASSVAVAPHIPVEQYQLKNGLTVLLSEDHSLPMASVEVLYLVGSGHERAGRTGFAHLFEHLMFQGSEHFDHEYFKPYEPIGAAVNGTTSQDRTNFFETVPSNYLKLPLFMESDRMQNLLPSLTQEKLDNQREVVKNERRQRYENTPYGMANWYLSEALYPPDHPYHHTPIGSHADLTAATLDDVKQFFQQYYVPANASLTLVGDFQSADAKQLIDYYFGSIPGGTRAARPSPAVPQPRAQHLQHTDDVPLPRVWLAWHSPALYAPGDAELDLLSAVLSAGKTSRLYFPLVYDKKIAKEVNAYQDSQALSSVYVIEATAAPGQSLDALYNALTETVKKALATPPTDDELQRAISAYKKSFYGRIEGVQSRASTISNYFLHTGKGDYLQQDLARYVEATPQKVFEAAKRVIDLEHAVRLDIVPGKKEIDPAVAALNPASQPAAPPAPAAKGAAK